MAAPSASANLDDAGPLLAPSETPVASVSATAAAALGSDVAKHNSKMSNLYLVTFLATLFILLLISGAIVMRSYFLRRRYQRRLEEALASGLVLAPRAQGGKRKRFGAKPGLFEVYLRASTHPPGTHPTSTGAYPTPTDKFGADEKYGHPSVGVGEREVFRQQDPLGANVLFPPSAPTTLPWGSWSTILPLSAQPIFVKRKYRGIAEPSSASPGRLVSLTRTSSTPFDDPHPQSHLNPHPENGYTILTARPPPSRVLNFFGIDFEAYVAAYASAQEAELERQQRNQQRNDNGRTPAQAHALARERERSLVRRMWEVGWIGDVVSRPRNRLRRSATAPTTGATTTGAPSAGANVELEPLPGPHPQQPQPEELTEAQERALEGQWALWQRMHEAGFPFDGPPPIDQMRRAALADLQAANAATATMTSPATTTATASASSNNAAQNAHEFQGLTDAQVEMLDGEERLLYRMWESGILPSLPASFALHARTETATTTAPVPAPHVPSVPAPAISTNGITAQSSSTEPQPQELTEAQMRALEGQRDLWQRMHEAGFPFDGPPPIEQMRRAALAELQAANATTTTAPAATAPTSSNSAARIADEFSGLTDAQIEMLNGEERLLYRMWESGILPSLPSSFALHARTENATTTAVSTTPLASSLNGPTPASSREPQPQELTEAQERALEGQRDLWQRMHEAGFPFDGPPPIEQMRRAALAELQAANATTTTAPATTTTTSSNSAARNADEFPGLTDAQIEMLDGQQRLVYRMWESGILPTLPSSFTRLAQTLNADANAASSVPPPPPAPSSSPPTPSSTVRDSRNPQGSLEAQERALVGQWALWERMREAGFPFDPAPSVEQIRRNLRANNGAARPRESEDDDDEPEGSVVIQMTDGSRVMGVPLAMPGSADDSDSEDEDGISGAMVTPTQRQMPVQAPGQASRVVVAADAPASASAPAPYTLALAAMPGATTAASRLSAPVSTGIAQQQIDPSVKIRVEMLQIAVLIAMPSPHRKSRKSSGKSKVPATATTPTAPLRASLDEDMDEIVSIAEVDADEDDEEDEWEAEGPLPEVVLGVSRVQYQHPSSTSSSTAAAHSTAGAGDDNGGPVGSGGVNASSRAVANSRRNVRRPTTTTTTRGGSLAFGIPG